MKDKKNLFLLLFSPSFFPLKDKHKNSRTMWCCGCLPAFHPRNKFHLRLFTVRHQWLQMLISDGEVGSLQISDSSSSFCFLLHLDVIWQKHHTVTANSCQLESCSATRGSLQTLIGEADTDSSNRFNRRGNSLFYFSEWNGGEDPTAHSFPPIFTLFLVLLFIFCLARSLTTSPLARCGQAHFVHLRWSYPTRERFVLSSTCSMCTS